MQELLCTGEKRLRMTKARKKRDLAFWYNSFQGYDTFIINT